ncbi:MAG: DUF4126 domain-containing protein [Opitutales bacterium]
MEEAMAVFAGIGLAAACGFRVFVPLFVASLAVNTGVEGIAGVNFSELVDADYAWLGSTPVTVALGVATALEIGSYYIPWVDNALDTIATPAAVVAGSFMASAFMPEFMGEGASKWILSAITGGGVAGLVQGASVITRMTSTASTGGAGNPAVSTGEAGGSVATAGLAVFFPIAAGLCVLVLLFFVLRTIFRHLRRRKVLHGAAHQRHR